MKAAALIWNAFPMYAALVVYAAAPGYAQRAAAPAIGSVSATDADVSDPQGALQIVGSRVQLLGSSLVKAHDHTATIQLARGGSIAVCRSSALHLTAAPVPGATAPLLLSLDRGALEVRMQTAPGDAILTPDLRLAAVAGKLLTLKLQVGASGDTCVDNADTAGAAVNVTDAFGESSYLVKPGQHVLFEHGDLHAVVDRETTPCGCPPDTKSRVSIAEALLAAPGTTKVADGDNAHPFPAAVSSGLADPAPLQTQGDGLHVQVATTLHYDPSAPPPSDDANAESALPTSLAAARARSRVKAAHTPEPPVIHAAAAPPPKAATLSMTAVSHVVMPQLEATPRVVIKRGNAPRPGPVYAFGRFLKRLFVR